MMDGWGYKACVERCAAILLLCYPTAMLAVKDGMNAIFIFMLLLALMVSFARPTGMVALVWQKEWAVYVASMFALTVAVFISQTVNQVYDDHPYDAPARYWLAVLIFLFLHRASLRTFHSLQLAFPIATITGFLMMEQIGADRMGVTTLDLIHFGDSMLVLGVLSLWSINWFGRDGSALMMLKIAGFIAGVMASLLSGSRGGWLAIPVFILIYSHFRVRSFSTRTLLVSVIVLVMSVSATYWGSKTFHDRVHEFAHDVATFDEGNRDTSTGIRWQLYRASIDVFLRHPIAGVGPEGFAREMKPMAEAGKLTQEAAYLGEGEVHNDILSKTAGMGILGLLSILAIYLVPFRMFWRAAKSENEQIKRAGVLGVSFVSAILVFGLTVEFLNLTLAAAFYSFTVAVLLAFCHNVHHTPDSSE